MKWYKDNIALQAELKREYPAVAELIDRLNGELEEALKYCKPYGGSPSVCAGMKANKDLERQLAEVSTEKEAAISLVHDYKAQLADARVEVERYKAGVEVEGYVAGVPTDISNDLYFASGWSKDLAHLSNKKVRVLIMKLEG